MWATGVGSMPGGDATAYAEAVRVVAGELGGADDLVFLPELPGRGVSAGLTGRAVAVAADLAFDLQPAGWRLTGAVGMDQRRARSLLAQDLDCFEEQLQGFAGQLKVQVCGPWTMAATVERPRGDKVLADHGGRRELAQALSEGLRDHIADVRRRVPTASRVVVQLDEPALPAVLAARVPTASGFGRHRSVDTPEAVAALVWLSEAITEAGAEMWVHCCAADVPVDALVRAGARAILVDLAKLLARGQEGLAEAVDSGVAVGLGVVPSTDPKEGGSDRQTIESALRWADVVGVDLDEIGPRVGITPSCGLAGATPAWARTALSRCHQAARRLPGGIESSADSD